MVHEAGLTSPAGTKHDGPLPPGAEGVLSRGTTALVAELIRSGARAKPH